MPIASKPEYVGPKHDEFLLSSKLVVDYSSVSNPVVTHLSNRVTSKQTSWKRVRRSATNIEKAATSSASKSTLFGVGSVITNVSGFVKNSLSKWFSKRNQQDPVIHNIQNLSYQNSNTPKIDNQKNKNPTVLPYDVNGAIMLLDLFIRKITGQKYVSTENQSISELEAQGYALNITESFERSLKSAAIKSDISVEDLNFDPVAVHSAIVRHIMSEEFSKIAKTLYSSAKEACPKCEQKDKFLAHLETNLKEMLAEKEVVFLTDKTQSVNFKKQKSTLGSSNTAGISVKPKTFLNVTSMVKGIENTLEL